MRPPVARSTALGMHASFHFHGDLVALLRPQWRATGLIVYPITRAASIKDAIEAFGPPHTEVGELTCNGLSIDFSWLVEPGHRFEIIPNLPPWDVTRSTKLRPEPLVALRFVVDINVGRLARALRMAGFDTLYNPSWSEQHILRAIEEGRLLLTRNLDLLKRKRVVFGRAVRAHRPDEQMREMLHLFGFEQPPLPLSRCLQCNTPLEPVDKTAILPRLEPLTARYFDSFHLCRHCDKLYWPGSHVDRMRRFLNQAP